MDADPQGKGPFWGLSGPLKSIVSHCCDVCSQNVNNGISATPQPTALLPTGRCHINFSPIKNLPPAMRPLVKIR